MMRSQTTLASREWKAIEKIAFRFFFIYFFIQAVPMDWKFYRDLSAINWSHLNYNDIFQLTRYMPQFFSGSAGFADWAIISCIACLAAVLWTIAGKNSKEYNELYYWLRVILRYRLAIGVIGYGFIKLFPMLAPFPSISNLNTNYGDFSAWKIFSMTLGIVPGYESFLGLVEILLGILLLYRKTATISAFLIIIFTGNVFVSNLAYEGGEYMYSFYLVCIALFLLAFDAIRLYTLFGLEKPTFPHRFNPSFKKKWKRNTRLILKSAFIFFFVVLYGFKTYSGYQNGSYQYPTTAGLPNASGLYFVTEFRLNNKIIPYTASDSLRWKDVVFEKWATISIRSNRTVITDAANAEYISMNDKERNYEISGSAGRHYFSYQIDADRNLLSLENKNKNYAEEKLLLYYARPDSSRIILSGINEKNDSLYVILDKDNKKYLLEEAAKQGRGKGLKL